jgi:predicted amino acid racemase
MEVQVFLRSLERTNATFVSTAIELHQAGLIPTNSYVVDLDAVAENAGYIMAEARKYGLTVYPMTKQFGRNPEVLKVISAAGADGFVAVDMLCARAIVNGGFQVGHLGHLVQIPRHEIGEAAAMAPSYWTVFSRDQAKFVSTVSRQTRQRLLLRVFKQGDSIVPTHAGGFAVEFIDDTIAEIADMQNVEIAGVTTYPSARFDRLSRQVLETPNVESMRRVANKLRALGMRGVQINMASELSSGTIRLAADGGATQVEPGHAFTGTSPYQIFGEVPERQAMIYLSEVSHLEGGGGFCFGGGLYECIGAVGHYAEALVARSGPNGLQIERARLTIPPNGVIDFYGRLDLAPGGDIKVGDSVIICTRPQAFFTRAFVVPVRGIQSNAPQVLGVWDVAGFPASNAPLHARGARVA